jgi:predicted acyltransferase (DUF342 family)
MSFRRYGGVTYNAKNNIVRSNYNTAANLSVTGDVGQDNSYITFLSDISGDIIFYGNIDISGNLDISGNAHVFGDLDVSGNENLQGNLLVYGNEDLRGNLLVYGNEDLRGNLDVSGNANIFGNLDVSGNENLQGNLRVYGNIDISGNLDVSGNFHVFGDLDVSGNENLQGNLTVYGNEDFRGNLDVSGNVHIFGDLDVSGNENLQGNLLVYGNEDLRGNLDVSGNTRIFENLDVSGNENLQGNLLVYGSSNFNGLVSAPAGVTGATGSFTNLYVSGQFVCDGPIYDPNGITGTTGSFTNLYASNNLQVDGNTNLGNQSNDTINIFGTLGVTGPSNLYGLVSAPNGITSATGSFDNLFVYNNADVCGNLFASYMYLTAKNQNYSTYPPNSVVPKSYVDTIGSGLKAAFSSVCATTKSLPGSGGSSGDVNPYGIPPDISYTDGYQVVEGDYVLVVCQNAGGTYIDGSGNTITNYPAPAFSSAVYNGEWIVSNGNWSRPASGTFSSGTDSVGGFSYVQNGLTHDNQALVQINNPGEVGTDNLQFTTLYQNNYEIGQGLNLSNNILSVDSSLNFINYLDSTPGIPNASGTLTIGSYTSQTIIGPTGPNVNPIIIRPGITGPTGSFTNLYVSGPSNQVGLITAPGGITGATGSFTNLNVSGEFICNGTIYDPYGITGGTGSFDNLYVSGTSKQVGLITAPGGITGSTGSFDNLYVSGPFICDGTIYDSNGITGGTGSFDNLYVSGTCNLNGNTTITSNSDGPTLQVVNTLTTNNSIQGAFTQTTNFNEGTILSCNGSITEIKMNNLAPGAHFTISNDGAFRINNTSVSTAPFTVGTNNLTILNNGNVGIANNNPAAILDITGTLRVSGVVSITNNTNSTAVNNGALTVTGGVGIALNTFMGGTLNVAGVVSITNNTNSTAGNNGALTVTGGVGIGLNTFMGGTLNVAGIVRMTNNTNSTSAITGALTVTGGVGIALNTFMGGTLNVAGNCTAQTFTSGSDYRLKSNIELLLPSRTIDDLKPVEYDLSGNIHDMGFIAHEVQEVLPFLVHGEKDGKNMQSLNYTGFIALLVKEVQDLKRDKKVLEERLDRIEQILNK